MEYRSLTSLDKFLLKISCEEVYYIIPDLGNPARPQYYDNIAASRAIKTYKYHNLTIGGKELISITEEMKRVWNRQMGRPLDSSISPEEWMKIDKQ